MTLLGRFAARTAVYARAPSSLIATVAAVAARTSNAVHRTWRRGLATAMDRATQPLPHTHPDLFKSAAELTPGITSMEYESRRAKLMSQLPDGAVAVLVGNPTTFASNKIFNVFQQNTDFLYLTGLDEPDAVLVLEKDSSAQKGYRMTLFIEYRAAHEIRWSGPATGPDAARTVFGTDTVMPNTQFAAYFDQLKADLASSHRPLYLDSPAELLSSQYHPLSPVAAAAAAVAETGTTPPSGSWSAGLAKLTRAKTSAAPPRPLSHLIQQLRAVKSPAEIAVMARSGANSGAAFADSLRAMRDRNLVSEHMLSAHLEFGFRMRGSKGNAYVPVVAGGPNACILHYVNNDMPLRQGETVLIDAGGQYGHYASDISRTYPISGKFSPAQRELYQAVLNVQQESIRLISTNTSLDHLHYHSISLMTEELRKLGFDVTDTDVSRDLYFHHLGHYLGLDVHDTPTVSRARKLREGMVITIEPGVYVSRDPRWPSRFHNIGIRIEDNVVVSASGEAPRVLTSSAPKTIEEIEQLS
ncbi:hypothetical protein GGF31_008990 [Allomyces arbusculus]|nr:hypothetical protein GGF31_008990 [Allomyces arbusculus]